MANKVPWYVSLDWRKISGTISVIATLGVIVFLVGLPGLIQDKKLEQYKGQTSGVVTEIIENMAMDQAHEGTRIYIASYTVKYSYQVDGLAYYGTEGVKATPNATRMLNKINASKRRQLVVRYDEARPAKSTILVGK